MQPLYQLSEHYLKALDFLTDPENDIDMQTAVDTIESLDGELDDKIANVAKMIVQLEHDAEGIKEIAKRQSERAKAIEKKADWLRDYLKENMQRTGHDKVEALDIQVKLAKTPPAVKVIDVLEIPKHFWITEEVVSLDKKAIKNAGGCPGAIVESGYRIAIK